MGGVHRFLLSPKWLLGHALVLGVLVTFPLLGMWQLDQLERVRERNATVAAEQAGDPRPLADAVADGLAPFTRVVAEGTYRAEGQMLSAPASRHDRAPGHQVLTPLETDAGTLLVDRGWVPFERDGVPSAVLEPPEGAVRVEGWLMPPERGNPGEGRFVGAIDPALVSERTGIDLLPAHLLMRDARPAPSGPLPGQDPPTGEGNHFSYAVQWFLFTAVVAVGYPILVYRTMRDRRSESSRPAEPQDSPEVPAGA